MDLEFHQLDLRYEGLRRREPERERRLIGSLSEHGQQVPIVVVVADERFVVVDGYKRVRGLRRLGSDTVMATRWDLSECEALILDRLLRRSGRPSVLEEAWLLAELQQRFSLGLGELAQRFGHAVSWVSRRLGLVRSLPLKVQDLVRQGRIVPHAATKYWLPLARANVEDCLALLAVLPKRPLSSREMGRLYTTLVASSPSVRRRILGDPELFLRLDQESRASAPVPSEALIEDLRVLCAVTRRAEGRLRQGAARGLRGSRRRVARRLLEQTRAGFGSLLEAFQKEGLGAGPDHSSDGVEAAPAGALGHGDRQDAADLPRVGEEDRPGRDRAGPGPGAGREGRAA
jgi:ParB family chromosome partitioning protein